jgi:plastocyanin
MTRHALILGTCVAAALPPPAVAEERVIAGPGTRYATPSVTIDQGEALLLANYDLTTHDVVAQDTRTNGEPLFRSPLVASGRQAEVAGVRSLTAGEYAFFCSLHPSMRGRVRVTTAGTPLPRPDRQAPVVSASVRQRHPAAAARGIRIRVVANEAATARLRAQVHVGGRVFAARPSVVELPAEEPRAVRVALPAAARKALSRSRRAAVTVTVRAVDAAGNESVSTVRHILRR